MKFIRSIEESVLRWRVRRAVRAGAKDGAASWLRMRCRVAAGRYFAGDVTVDSMLYRHNAPAAVQWVETKVMEIVRAQGLSPWRVRVLPVQGQDA